ncbi:hypothetical protein IWW50_006692 [Coemansia erecta]|nr:hypothetical protein GGF43_006947 [Coemansia sp. RSA 2618]KAJ2815851.1 hypothetical protein IWW50_006692 [Coemansia erecta]
MSYSRNNGGGSRGYRSGGNNGGGGGGYRNNGGGYRSNGGGYGNSGSQHVYTDGACSGNGRQGSRAGYGVWYGDGDSRNASRALGGHEQTNQRAELAAMNHALRNSDSNQPLVIHSDSKYGIQAMTSWGDKWENNGYRTSTGGDVKNQDLIREGRDIIGSRNAPVSFQHVAGHSGNYGNDQADSLATQGARR